MSSSIVDLPLGGSNPKKFHKSLGGNDPKCRADSMTKKRWVLDALSTSMCFSYSSPFHLHSMKFNTFISEPILLYTMTTLPPAGVGTIIAR